MHAAENEYGCWVRIGSYGLGACPRLGEGGCRDCPEFQVKGLGLYDREPPEGYAQEWTRILADEKPVQEEDATSVLVFRIGQEWLALRTARFEEIIPPRPPHTVPGLRSRAFLGLVNVSGVLLPCMSLAEVLGMAPAEPAEAASGAARAAGRMAVVAGADGRFVLPVDEIAGTHRLTPAERIQTPVTVSRTPRHFSSGVFTHNGSVVGILDEEALFPALTRSVTG
jgi:chemotaxis-related protein WspD